MTDAEITPEERARWEAKARRLRAELTTAIGLFFEGSCSVNPIEATHHTVRALLAAYLETFGEGYNVETFIDFVAAAVAEQGGWNHNQGIAELFERRAREKRMMFKPSAAAAKGWETRRRNRRARDQGKD